MKIKIYWNNFKSRILLLWIILGLFILIAKGLPDAYREKSLYSYIIVFIIGISILKNIIDLNKNNNNRNKAKKGWLYDFIITNFPEKREKDWSFLIHLEWDVNGENVDIEEKISLENYLFLKKNFRKDDSLAIFINPQNTNQFYLDMQYIKKQFPNTASISKYDEDDYIISSLEPYYNYFNIWWKICVLIAIFSSFYGLFFKPIDQLYVWWIVFWLMFGIFLTFIAKKIQILKEKQK